MMNHRRPLYAYGDGASMRAMAPENDESPQAVVRAWNEEIARRMADCDAGRTQGIPLEQVHAEIQLLLRQHAKA